MSHQRSAPALLSRTDVEAAGFTGYVRFDSLPASGVPAGPGVYVVRRAASEPPVFLALSPAGHFKGKDPSVPIDVLRAAWVEEVDVVYIGKAGGKRGLRARLDQYRCFGAGEPVGHWGGRFVWQLAEADRLLVAWRATPEDNPAPVELALLAAFERTTGRLPFANLRH